MAPKIKVSKEDIIKTAVELIRKNGADTINARGIAAALNCSTQPIFSNFLTMEELLASVKEKVYGHYLEFLKREAENKKYPQYKAYGMAYIRFAKDERELFKLLFMCDRRGEELIPTPDFSASVEMIMQALNVTRERAKLLHLEMWTCVHGIATMLATSFLNFEWELISNILTDVYIGLREKIR